MVGGYKVITLCGSTKFREQFIAAQKRLTLEGNIVISVGLFGHSGDDEVWEGMSKGQVTKTKEMLDDMHKRKIDMADEIYVINYDGYIGESTRSEIEYAKAHGKIVKYLEGEGLAPVYRMQISELGLSVRAHNGLMRAGYRTVWDVAGSTKEKIRKIRTLNDRATQEIFDRLEGLGIVLEENKEIFWGGKK